jgi:hypothetical protein
MIKDFFRFYVATSHPRIDNVPTVDSIYSITEFFFAGFTRVIETVLPEDIRSEVYSVRVFLVYASLRASLTIGSGYGKTSPPKVWW